MNKPTNFELKIELGNDAMQHPEDVADALQNVAHKINTGFNAGVIYDLSGNIVGHFAFDSKH